jgi:ABC-type sugar transport system ATPase subunit
VTVLRDGRVVHSAPAAGLTVRAIVALMIGDAARQDRSAARQRRVDPPVRLTATDLTTGPVADMSFDVREGEVLGFAGLEGSGVTEVFAALFGERRPTGGSFTLDGRPFRPRSPADAVRWGVASIPADRRTDGLLMEHPIGSNIALVVLDRLRGRFGLVSDAQVAMSARSYMDRLRIRARSERVPVGQLSGGNQQKVVLAKWLEARPRVLLLNDPMRGIDVGAKAEIREVILELAGSGISVLVWSSEAEELLGMCDRIMVLRAGTVTATLEPATTDRRTLLLAVVGDSEGPDDA